MENNLFKNDRRKSDMQIGEPYFWTNTIYQWKHLLSEDSLKDIIISSLEFLSKKELIEVYGFVIMPNHIHLLWQLNKMNGKEKPNASFQKFTAHAIRDKVKSLPEYNFEDYFVEEYDRQYRIWQRDPLATLIEGRKTAEIRLNYIHNNPIQEQWSLVSRPEDYKYSSANFYENAENAFSFLIHFANRFG